jgi:glyoxylase-like metal-dependent hydrolase (beta-lactamase superfamily II)
MFLLTAMKKSLSFALVALVWAASVFIPAAAQSITPQAVTAPPAQLKTQVPGYYRMQLGAFEITALFDGVFEMDTKMLLGAKPGEIQSLVARMFQTMPAVPTAVNAYVVHTGKNLVLIDAGSAKLFGPSLGFTVDNMRAAGIAPEHIDTVLITHLHGDHVNGIIDAQGRAVFPRATVHVAKADADFWLSEEVSAKAPKEAQGFFKMARDAIAPYRAAGRYKTFDRDMELVPGISAVASPGHTPGHTSFLMRSNGQQLMMWGDIIHNFAVQFVNPDIAFEFDVDSKQAVVTRRIALENAAKEKYWVAGSHMPFPGIGHVRKDDAIYTWVPIEYGPVK